jgi:6-phosphofructokinase 1
VILIPEIPYDLNVIAEYLRDREAKKKSSSIIVVAEGIKKKKGVSAGHYIATELSKLVEEQMRETVLGYIQRGGSPSSMDRILATRFGSYAAHLIARGEFGNMVAMKDGHVTHIPLSETEGKLNLVPKDHPLVKRAMDIGTCFGA